MKKWVLFTIHGHQVLCERLDAEELEYEVKENTGFFILIRMYFDGVSADLKLGYSSKESRNEFFDNQDELLVKAQSIFEGTAAMLDINYTNE
jgi:hypothetical protein